MGAARPASRTPGTVPGLPHPNPHGRHAEAHMELKHDGRSADALDALVKRLLSTINREDSPELSPIDNKRRRYTDTLFEICKYFSEADHDKHPQLWTYIAGLGVALEDLIDGVTDPLFVTKGSKRDSMRIWGARLPAALGLECLIRSGLSRGKAASHAAIHYPALASLTRGTNRDLKGSLLSWYDYYVERRVPVPQLRKQFRTKRREHKAANRSPAEYRKEGEQALARAVKWRPSKFQTKPYFCSTRRASCW